VDSSRELPQVADAGLQLRERLVHQSSRLVRGVRQPSLRELQAEHRAHQLLLGAVV
jgi:hypothetical protein